ncbi:hypothetical protein M501DRAFT_1020988 [Patellaria atrata CBS 101060]|uniref:Uncharacterized protein n=1 Tax=Patellaria atrata CBS 101060 TaxID=1346257 RepID=A0A9P4S255_9PEZI|nr:hypothetical protein M501DRAFT_1020988 [Patellaria atrata CBS 101060]
MASVQHCEQPESGPILDKSQDLRPDSEEFVPNSSRNTPQPTPQPYGIVIGDCLDLPPIVSNTSVPAHAGLQTYVQNFGPTPPYVPMQPSFSPLLPSFSLGHIFLLEF